MRASSTCIWPAPLSLFLVKDWLIVSHQDFILSTKWLKGWTVADPTFFLSNVGFETALSSTARKVHWKCQLLCKWKSAALDAMTTRNIYLGDQEILKKRATLAETIEDRGARIYPQRGLFQRCTQFSVWYASTCACISLIITFEF